MLRYGSSEFADDCSYLTVIFSSAKAGAQLSDSVIGVGGHNIAGDLSNLLGRLLAGPLRAGQRTATRKVIRTLLI